MMAFVIPVKSKSIASDWASFSRLLNRCIKSICQQTNTNFKIIIACHEIPETDFKNDSRVHFLQVEFLPPQLKNNADDLWIKRADKGQKIRIGAKYALKLEAL